MSSALKLRSSIRALATTRTVTGHSSRLQEALSRSYATQSSLGGSSSKPTRKQVTVTSDDGRLRWNELSGREKTARATQQTGNFLIIVVGALMTGGVFTLLYLEVFAPDSKTRQFNHAVDRIKDDPRCTELLGNKKKIRAYGETTWNKWTRNRPIATTVQKDRMGREHLRMHFHVAGPLGEGVVHVHMVKNKDTHEYEYHLLALDVKGHHRIYLENAEAAAREAKKKEGTIFGIRWR